MSDKEIQKILLKLKTLEAENEKLKEENAYLKFRLEEFQSRRYKSDKKRKPPDDTPPVIPHPGKKRGGLFGHLGWFRRKPKRIDRIEDVTLDTCPSRGSKDISECAHIEEHIQEDIIMPVVETVAYRRRHYYCKACKQIVSGTGRSELRKSYIGPRAKSLAAFLKYVIKISDRDIRTLFKKLFNMDIAVSTITLFKSQLKDKALPVYKELLEYLKKSPFIHADETGWKVDGINHWLWKFSNKKASVSHIDRGRGQKVILDTLGEDYGGVLISDFLSAYNKIDAKAKQRCLVHLLRDLRKVADYWHDDKEVLRYSKRLKKIIEDAMTLHKEYLDKEWDEEYYKKRAGLNDALQDFDFPNPNKRILKRFAKRLRRHKGELLTFLYEKGIDPHNNHAEQQIRPDVLFRKITFGNRSAGGAENHSVLMSILQTAKLNKMDPITVLEKILLPHHVSPFSNILSPPDQNGPSLPQNNAYALAYSPV